MIAAAGFVELSRGPYFGLKASVSEAGAYIIEAPERGSPMALALEAGQSLAGTVLERVAGQPIGANGLIEDPDYIGDRRGIAEFFEFQDGAWVNISRAMDGRTSVAFDLIGADGTRFSASVQPERMGFARAVSRTWLMLLLGFFALGSGYLLAMRRPEDPNALRFFAMTLAVELIFSSFGVYTARDVVLCPPVFRVLFAQNTVAFVSFFCFFPWFFLHFPVTKPFLTKKPWRAAAYAIAGAAAFAGVTRVFGSLSNVFFLAALMVGAGALLHGYVTANSLVERYQIRWILLGTAAFVAVFCATAIVPSLLTGRRLVSDKVPSLFFALIPLSIFASVEKFRLMDIDTIIDVSLAYAAAMAIVALIDVLVIYLLITLTPFDPSSNIIAASIFVCLAFSLVYVPLRAGTLRAVKAALKRPEVDPISAMLGVSAALSGADSPKAAIDAFGEFLVGAFGARAAAAEAWIEGKKAVSAEGSALTLGIGLDALENLPSGPAHLHSFIPSNAMPELADSVYIPMGRLLGGRGPRESIASCFSGYMTLSRRSTPSMYSRADLSVLKALSQELTFVVDGLIDRDKARRAEADMMGDRVRIARDMHDGLGGALGTSLMLVDGLSSSASDPGSEAMKAELRRILDDSLGELRALVWTMNDDESDVESLAIVVRDRLMPPLRALGYRCAVSWDGLAGTRRLPSRVRMGLYRIAQEFVANCAKHARPGRVDVSFALAGAALVCQLVALAPPKAEEAPEPANLNGGNGLRNIEARAAELGASVSSEIRGDERRLVVSIPLVEA